MAAAPLSPPAHFHVASAHIASPLPPYIVSKAGWLEPCHCHLLPHLGLIGVLFDQRSSATASETTAPASSTALTVDMVLGWAPIAAYLLGMLPLPPWCSRRLPCHSLSVGAPVPAAPARPRYAWWPCGWAHRVHYAGWAHRVAWDARPGRSEGRGPRAGPSLCSYFRIRFLFSIN
jgi:hypothetical protein